MHMDTLLTDTQTLGGQTLTCFQGANSLSEVWTESLLHFSYFIISRLL